MTRDRVWHVLFGALGEALERTAAVNKAKFHMQAGYDGFFTYKGTLDVTSMSEYLTDAMKAAIDEYAEYERLKAKFGRD